MVWSNHCLHSSTGDGGTSSCGRRTLVFARMFNLRSVGRSTTGSLLWGAVYSVISSSQQIFQHSSMTNQTPKMCWYAFIQNFKFETIILFVIDLRTIYKIDLTSWSLSHSTKHIQHNPLGSLLIIWSDNMSDHTSLLSDKHDIFQMSTNRLL